MGTAFAPGFPQDNAFDHPDRPVLDYRAMSPGMFREDLPVRRARLAADPLDAQGRALGRPWLVLHGDRDRMYSVRETVARCRAGRNHPGGRAFPAYRAPASSGADRAGVSRGVSAARSRARRAVPFDRSGLPIVRREPAPSVVRGDRFG